MTGTGNLAVSSSPFIFKKQSKKGIVNAVYNSQVSIRIFSGTMVNTPALGAMSYLSPQDSSDKILGVINNSGGTFGVPTGSFDMFGQVCYSDVS